MNAFIPNNALLISVKVIRVLVAYSENRSKFGIYVRDMSTYV